MDPDQDRCQMVFKAFKMCRYGINKTKYRNIGMGINHAANGNIHKGSTEWVYCEF